MLFNMFIKDLELGGGSEVAKFADDTNIFWGGGIKNEKGLL